MQKIKFTKGSILASFWDENGEKWQDRNIGDSDLPLSWYLPYEVVIDQKVTIRDVLTHLSKYEDQVNFMFVNYLRGLSITDLIKVLTTAKTEKPGANATVACLIWVCKISEAEEDDIIDLYPTLMAMEIDTKDNTEIFKSAFDIDVNCLLDLELIADDLLEIFHENEPTETDISGITRWRLFDFLSGLLDELVSYSFANRLIQISEFSNLPPMTSAELFKHMESLDKFFNNGQNDT